MAKYLDMNGVAYLLVRVREIVEDVTSGALDLTDYVTRTELQNELNSLNINIDLSKYVTTEALTTALASYVKPSALASYVKTSTLTSTLANYATTEQLEDCLQESDLVGYATETFVTNAINNAQLDSGDGTSIDLSIYATKTDLENKADKTHTHDNYATKEYVSSAINELDIDVDLTNYYTKTQTDAAITAAQPDLSDFATEAYVNEKIENIEIIGEKDISYGKEEPTDKTLVWINPEGSVTEYATVEYVDDAVSRIDVSGVEIDLTGYVKEADLSIALNNKASLNHTHSEYLTEHQDISGKADINHTHSQYLTQHQDISGKAEKVHTHKMSDITDYTAPTVDLSGYYTKTQVDTKIAEAKLEGEGVDLSGYALKDHTHSQYLTSHQDISGKSDVGHKHTLSDITNYSAPNLTNYATKTYVQEQIDALEVTGAGGVGKADSNTKAEIFNDYTNNVASADYAHAEGKKTTASGRYSHAEGNETTASGDWSHAEGQNTKAEGVKSHAEGHFSQAISEASHAEGSSTKAKGKYSHAEGINTTASGEAQHVQGRYNIEDTANRYAHIVGNGKFNTNTLSNDYSNCHTLDWNGNAWFKGKVFVGGTSMDDATELGSGSGGGLTEDEVNALIDIKLGVIENGTY